MMNTASEQDGPKAIGWYEARFFNLPVNEGKLLAKQGVFSDQLGLASEQVGN